MLLVSVLVVVVVVRLCKGLLDSLKPVLLRQLDLVDKMTTIAAATDVAAYQAIQVMHQPPVGYDGDHYDPSDEAEALREAAAHGWDPERLSDGEAEELRSQFSV